MKKLALLIVILCSLQFAFSQTAGDALGIRFGGSDGVSAEISYQNFIGGNNRLEFDLGFIDAGWYDGFKFSLLYHWVGNIDNGLYWYVGAGGSIGAWDVNDNGPGWDDDHGPWWSDSDYDRNDGVFLDADGQLGIEYYFNIPLQISLDIRPEFGLVNDDFDMGYGLGLRYVFGAD
ncbi:MAG: hypothetical protein ACHQFW_07170 [Chitinophagales bacterium]